MTRKHTRKKVALGLSGGVDSSVSALLLKEQGFDVTAVYMKCWDIPEDGCASDENKAYAIQTAIHLDVDFKELNFINEYKSKVINYFYDEYKAGRTPNPDVVCNKEIKFGIFYDWALENNFDYVATGHYARIMQKNKEFYLYQGKDQNKDQSYFLYRLNQEQLKNILFPVGDLQKEEVKKIAKEHNLPSYKRAESMGICFVGEVDIKEFLKRKLKVKKGDVLDKDGNKIGTHEGAWFYTIGQRHGFDVTKYHQKPLYIISKNADSNTLVVGEREEVKRSNFIVEDVHWINKTPLKENLQVRIRHLGSLYECNISKKEPLLNVVINEPVFAVAPGQSAVFYDKEKCLGGGIIKN